MKRLGLIAVLSMLVVAISATAAQAAQTTTFNYANAPTGAHLQTGVTEADVTCTVTGLTVTCPSSVFDIEGIGNTNATATLTTTYTATVNCVNKGGNIVAVKAGTFTVGPTSTTLPAKNGRVTVTQVSTTAPSEATFLAQQTCPNPNWTPELAGPITLSSFTYTVTFEGFTGAFITITGNDP